MCNERLSPANTICACPGETLNFTCTIISTSGTSGAATIWNGSAFTCSENEIPLLHNGFNSSNGQSGVCNNGAILARSVGVNGNCYTSQLRVTVSAGLNNKTVACLLSPIMQQIGYTLITVANLAGIHQRLIEPQKRGGEALRGHMQARILVTCKGNSTPPTRS